MYSIKRFSIFEIYWMMQVDPSATAQFIRSISESFMLLRR